MTETTSGTLAEAEQAQALAEAQMQAQCRLISADGEEFVVPRSIARQSVLIREMIEECEDDEAAAAAAAEDDVDIPDVPLPNVKGNVLKTVLEFCTMHAKDPLPDFEKPLISEVLTDYIPPAYVEFVDRDRDEIFAIISCANYLDIASLLDLACAKIAAELKAMTPAERTEAFGPPVNLTAEQEALVHEYNKWETGPDVDDATIPTPEDPSEQNDS